MVAVSSSPWWKKRLWISMMEGFDAAIDALDETVNVCVYIID
jgi:hypothetical protein